MDRLKIWLLGTLVAAAACCHMPLLYAYRSVWTSRFPSYVEHWPNDGRPTLLGIYGIDNADELIYAARVQEASRRLVPRDPFVGTVQPSLGLDYLAYQPLGLLQALTRDANATWLLARFLSCLLWFVLVFHLVSLLTPERPLAVFCAAVVCWFSHTLSLMFVDALGWSGGLARSVLSGLWSVAAYGRTEGVWRVPRPALTLAALLGVTALWAKAFRSKGWGWWVATGAAVGALAYVRIDVWSTMLGAACLFPVVAWLALRRWDPRWAAPAALGLLLSLPMVGFALHPPEDFALKGAFGKARQLDWRTLLYLPVIGWALKRRRDLLALLFVSILAAVMLICNSSLLTGRATHFFLWRFYGNVYLWILLLCLLPERLRSRDRLWRLGTAAGLVVILAQNTFYAAVRYPWHGLHKAHEAPLEWLKKNAAPDAVVAVLSPEVNALVPSFTYAKVLVANGAPNVSLVPAAENVLRLREAAEVLGADPERLFADLMAPEIPPETRHFIDRPASDLYGLRAYCFGAYLPASVPPLWEKTRWEAGRARFPVDYVWVGPLERRYAAPAFPKGSSLKLELAFKNDEVSLYRVLR